MFRRLFSRLFFNSMVVLLAAIGVFGLVLGNILSEAQYQTVVRQMVEDAKDIAQNYNYLLNRQISGQVMADAISSVAEDSELCSSGATGSPFPSRALAMRTLQPSFPMTRRNT